MKRQEVKKDLANPAQFGPPQVSPAVTDPRAQEYAKSIQARRGPPKYATPVAGGPTPPIPRLDSDPTGTSPMSDQASEARVASTGPFSGAGSLFQEAGPPQPPSGGALPTMSRPPPGLLPNDLLPDEALKDPAFRDGTGARYAAAQPALAYKYGIIRNKQRIPPQQLGQQTKGLSPKTVAGLQALQDAQKHPPPNDKARDDMEQDKRVMNEAAAGSAGMAGRLGNSPTDGPQPDAKPSKTVAEVTKNMDDFDFNMLREVMMKDIINNEDQRNHRGSLRAPINRRPHHQRLRLPTCSHHPRQVRAYILLSLR